MPDMQERSDQALAAAQEDGNRASAPALRTLDDEAGVEGAAPETDSDVPCEFTTGIAGTGKTFTYRAKIEDDPTWGLLCATTGIAAVNLGTSTLNSQLGYFDTASLRDSYVTRQLETRIRKIAQGARRLVIDEVSMMDAEQLTLIYSAVQAYNGSRPHDAPPFGIVCVGDYCQLPPVKAEFAFRSAVWPEFAAHTTRLTKQWRQDSADFLLALNAARAGDGPAAAEGLSLLGIEWHSALDIGFDGTTLIPRNEQVDRFNTVCLARLHTPALRSRSRRWGRQDAGWKNVPDTLDLKVGAYVMILANAPREQPKFGEDAPPPLRYANGDCGHLKALDSDGTAHVELCRNGDYVAVPRIVRSRGDRSSKPDGWSADAPTGDGEWISQPHRQSRAKLYVDGQVEFLPLRLAWASTVHKCQGLTLDRIQVDIRDHFFNSYAMAYVALSRARTVGGMRIVGQREKFIKQVRCNPEVRQWI